MASKLSFGRWMHRVGGVWVGLIAVLTAAVAIGVFSCFQWEPHVEAREEKIHVPELVGSLPVSVNDKIHFGPDDEKMDFDQFVERFAPTLRALRATDEDRKVRLILAAASECASCRHGVSTVFTETVIYETGGNRGVKRFYPSVDGTIVIQTGRTDYDNYVVLVVVSSFIVAFVVAAVWVFIWNSFIRRH